MASAGQISQFLELVGIDARSPEQKKLYEREKERRKRMREYAEKFRGNKGEAE
jgi:hypothetical protein